MKIPTKLKIAGFDWQVIQSDDETVKKNLFGCTVYAEQKIYIAKSIPQQKKEHTLLHEIMHAVFWHFGLDRLLKSSDDEELIVNGASSGLFHVLKDNGFLK